MMGRGFKFLSFAVCALLLIACGEKTRVAFGLGKHAPDEFAVVTRAPLKLPPDYGLRPPSPGVARPQEQEVKDSARQILLQAGADGSADGAANGDRLSRGEAALLTKAGASKTNSSIRAKVNRESSILAENDGDFISRIMFWQEREPPGLSLDATAESRRLRENAALGNPVTTGRTPVIEREERGWLEGLFN